MINIDFQDDHIVFTFPGRLTEKEAYKIQKDYGFSSTRCGFFHLRYVEEFDYTTWYCNNKGGKNEF